MAQTLTIPNSFNNGEVIDAPEMNANFTAIKNYCETMSEGGNFDAGAINTTDIADSAITAAKIASGAVTSAKIQTSVSLTTPILGVASATSLAVSGNSVSHLDSNLTTGAYTLAATDDGRIVIMNNSSATNLTVPADSTTNFTVGTQIIVWELGTGQTTIVAAGGVTVNGTPGLKLRAQYSGAVLIKRAANTWFLLGDISS